MFAGYFIVVAIHFSTCYYLLSKGGLLAAISSFVILMNAAIGIVFYTWDKNYKIRLNLITDFDSQNSIKQLLSQTFISTSDQVFKIQKSAGTILIISVTIMSLVIAVALFVFITLPYFNRIL